MRSRPEMDLAALSEIRKERGRGLDWYSVRLMPFLLSARMDGCKQFNIRLRYKWPIGN